jgi:hypothetical protein
MSTLSRSSPNTQYDWVAGAPAKTDNTNLDWVAGSPNVLWDSLEAVAGEGQPTMRRWGGIPGMVYTGRGSW